MSDQSELFVVGEGAALHWSEIWECSARLRWKDGVLQQCWWEKTKGKYEWRDVPTAEECEIK